MGFYETLNKNIAKYGGEDSAYKEKLTTHFRDLLGYSNYKSKMMKAVKAPLDLSSMKGNITPAGIKELIHGASGMKRTAVSGYESMVGEIDQAAGMLAREQIAREKEAAAKARAAREAARNKTGLENGVAFTPSSALDQKILEYMQKPGVRGEQGRTKSLQEFEAELNAFYSDPQNMVTDAKNKDPMRVWTEEEIRQRIEELIPSDYIGNEDKYYLMSLGYSEKQAISHQGAWKYASGQMSDAEKMMFETQNKTLAANINEYNRFAQAITDIHAQEEFVDPVTGNVAMAPKYTFTEIKEMYSDMTPTQLESLKREAMPVFRNNAFEYINEQLDKEVRAKDSWLKKIYPGYYGDRSHIVTQGELLTRVYEGQDPDYEDGGMAGVMDTKLYKKMETTMKADYGDVLTPDEISRLLLTTLLNRVATYR